MGRGLSASCQLEDEDSRTAIYSYVGDDATLPEGRRAELRGQPGLLAIQKRSLERASKRVKKVRAEGGRTRTVSEPVYHTPDVIGHYEDGDIAVDLCGADKDLLAGRDAGQPLPRIAWNVLLLIYQHYMRHGKLPEHVEFEQ